VIDDEQSGDEPREDAPEPTGEAEAPTAPAEEAPAEEAPAEEPQAEADAPAEEQPAEQPQEQAAEEPPATEPTGEPEAPVAPAAETQEAAAEGEADEQPAAPRVKPEIPGADLQPDLVLEGEDEVDEAEARRREDELQEDRAQLERIETTIDLAAGARYRATGKRKTAVARVILKPGTGAYTINGRTLDAFFPRPALQRNIRQPLETVGYEDRMDVIASMHGGGVSSQAGALRHGISRALLEADPNLRGDLKRRGFLTRDARVKERKKAGLKKARKRPQFSKR
jgi:small subunit ribosomal protein S9